MAAVVLHRSRRGRVGFGEGRRCRVFFEQRAGHAARAELQRQHQAGRAAADDGDIGGFLRHGRVVLTVGE
jgi:hypothetical protein